MPAIAVSLGIIINADQVLIAKRPAGTHLAGYWEFPGGKVQASETSEMTMRRELLEELGITVTQCHYFSEYSHQYEDRQIQLTAWVVTAFDGQAVGRQGQTVRWLGWPHLNPDDFPDGNRQLIVKLKKSFMPVVNS